MSDFDWRAAVRGVAPVLGAALGGPLGGAALSTISSILLGRPDGTEEDLAAATLTGIPAEKVVELKKAELDFQLEMRRIDQEADNAALQDTANARQQTIALATAGSSLAWGAPVVSTMVVLGYFFCVWLLFLRGEDLPDNITQIVAIMFGALQLAFGQVVNYWLGSSAGSKRNADANRAVTAMLAKKG